MFKNIVIVVLGLLCFLGKVNEVRRAEAYKQKIAGLETIINRGEHCLSICEEMFNQWGC